MLLLLLGLLFKVSIRYFGVVESDNRLSTGFKLNYYYYYYYYYYYHHHHHLNHQHYHCFNQGIGERRK